MRAFELTKGSLYDHDDRAGHDLLKRHLKIQAESIEAEMQNLYNDFITSNSDLISSGPSQDGAGGSAYNQGNTFH
jgi:hypothetical protein